jgi:hypothetical protein
MLIQMLYSGPSEFGAHIYCRDTGTVDGFRRVVILGLTVALQNTPIHYYLQIHN